MPNARLTEFREDMLKRVKEIPSGRVVTYGDLGDRKRADVGGAMAYVVDHEDSKLPGAGWSSRMADCPQGP